MSPAASRVRPRRVRAPARVCSRARRGSRSGRRPCSRHGRRVGRGLGGRSGVRAAGRRGAAGPGEPFDEIEHGRVRQRQAAGDGFQRRGLPVAPVRRLHRFGIGADEHRAGFVQAAAAGPPGHLQKFLLGQQPPPPAVEFGHAVEANGAHGHVDAHGERLRREHDPQNASLQQVLDDVFDQRDQAGVVDADAPLPHVPHGGQPRHVVGAKPGLLQNLTHRDVHGVALVGAQEVSPPGQVPGHPFALPAAEGEINARKQPFAADVADDVQVAGLRRRLRTAASRRAAGPVRAAGPAGAPGTLDAAVPAGAAGPARAAGRRVDGQRIPFQVAARDVLPRFGMREGAAVVGEVVQAQRHGPLVVDDGSHRLTQRPLQPRRELADVGHRGRKPEDAHAFGQQQNGFLPDRAPLGMVDVVDFIKDDPVGQGRSAFPPAFRPTVVRPAVQQHVAQHFRGHDDQQGVRVLGQVAGHDARAGGAEGGAEAPVFLVDQGFDGRRVHDAAARLQRLVHQVVRNQALARARRRADQRGRFLLQCDDGLYLKLVQPVPTKLEGRTNRARRHGRRPLSPYPSTPGR